MKFLSKVVLSLAITLSIVFPVFNFNVYNVNAAAVTTPATGYTQASDVDYVYSGKYLHNWGARGEDATFLTTKAASYYTSGITYSVLSESDGGTTQSNAHQSALYKALQSMMKSKHNYIITYDATRPLYGYTDGVSNNSSKLSTFYTGKLVSSTWDGGTTYNREHVWPRSKSINQSKAEDSADIMMLRPETPNANSSRGNKAFGLSTGYYIPEEYVRGDIARTLLYGYVRWGNASYMWGTGGVIENSTILLQWMIDDPVDTWELGRNDAVESITGVRNVFVDYPEYAFLLFGKAVPNYMQTPSGLAKNGLAGGDGLPELPESGGNDTPSVDVNELLAKDTLTIAEATTIGKSLAHDTTTEKKFNVTGKIISIVNETYGNMTIKDDNGNTIYVYGTYNEDGSVGYGSMSDKPQEGDTVTLYTVVGNYNGAQLKDAWITDVVKGTSGGGTTPDYDDETILALFDFGEKGSAAHVDGNDVGTSITYTVGNYSLKLQNATKVFAGAFDQTGNSCLKLGTGSVAAAFEFTVPSDVEYVVLNIAQYKANPSKVSVNGTTYTISTSSNLGEYTAITVDTTSNKKVTFATLSGGLRVMIDSISFHSSTPSQGGNEGGGEDNPPAEIETITVSQAVEMGSSMTHNTTTDVKYYVSGVVTEITNTQYGNMYIKDESGASILVYGTYSADGETRFDSLSVQPEVGDTVKLLTVVGNYNGAQLKNAWILEIIPGEGGNQGGGEDNPPVEIETITISQALEMGAALTHNTVTPVKYYVEGVIVEVKDTYYGNMTIKDEQGNTILVYGSFSADGVKRFGEMENTPVAGDTVKLLSVVSNYNGAQLKNAWILEFSNSGNQGGNEGGGENEPCKHSYGDWVVVEPATETEEGLKVKTCRHCGDEVSETIPALGATDSSEPSDSTSESDSDSALGSDSESSSERQKAQGCNSSLSGSLLGSLGLVFALFAIAKKSKEN